ncbi:hypothetical protein TWF106_003377 [Orbilia oligospora]|uniref:Uncharacterized protein n=1 Tax=Orbilia oligospora TaxID=2813651 RepID=A0A6G1MKZ8_ORBOL|nr:hypothetical protein TWF788_001705 [Orbilia oligospora]KAF3197493.1 hypothetical protein TWF679_003120 [Orbilia oligospora]KAF3200434.1 hypothetical protein TWF106_003377 [Orbilia oligospora]KAF3260390.1 hypothetical protein TWF192_009677 [Orbilia oligospora]
MLSIDAGRPATMSYSFQQHQIPGNMLANGFGASRGKPDAVNKIPIPKLPTISASLYDDPNALYPPTPTARSSGRAQLLAGLRTAPKTPIGSEYASIGHFDGEFQGESPSGAGNLNFLMNRNERAFGNDPPRHQLAHSGHLHASRPSLPQDHFNNIQFSNFGGLPTPPTSHYVYQGDQDYEAQAYADLLARNISLAQQQQQHFIQQLRLAQQTQQLQQIHQQMQPLPIQSAMSQVLGTPPISPAIYTPTVSNLSQGHPIYNPNVQTNVQGFTSQQNRHKQGGFSALAQSEQTALTSMASQLRISPSPPLGRPAIRTPPSRSTPSPTKEFNAPDRVMAKKTPSPPPASASTFRRGHKKCISLSGCSNMNPTLDGGPKTSIPRLSGVPSTPLNSTFGGRGDHPIRQPRGPPALEEVIAKPTAKYEGSKNFSSRQRRRALTKLVNAGLERRVTKQVGPASSMMPVSEHDSSDQPGESGSTDHTMRKDTPLDIVSISRPEGRRTPRRMGLAAPHFAAHSAEKRRSAVF